MNNSQTIPTTTLTRQEFLKVSGLGLAGITLLGTFGCGGGGSGGEGGGPATEGFVFTSSGSSYQRAQIKAWLRPYSKETGTTIRQDWPTDYEKIQSMVENDQVIWDVVNVSNDFGLQSTGDLLEPLARDRTPSRALVRRTQRRRSSQRRVRQTTTVLGGEDCDLLFMLLLSNRNENDLEY